MADGLKKQMELNPSYRILNIFISHNVEPKGHTSELYHEVGNLLYAIGTSLPINLPLAIYKHMLRTLTVAKNVSLP